MRALSHLLSGVGLFAALSLGGCKPVLSEGRYACRADAECPSGWFCREDRLCWKTRIPPGPTHGSLAPLGGERKSNSGASVLRNDGFQSSDRVCGQSGACVSGGFEP